MRLLLQWALLAAACVCGQAAAQGFASKPVRIIVAFPAGGGTDIIARLLAPKLTETWGQQVIVDNRPGASGIIGTELAAKAAPDGHTLFMGTMGNFSVNKHLFPTMSVDPVHDFVPVTQVVAVHFVMIAHPSLPAKNVKELVALARARPGQLAYGSSGAGGAPHLAGELLKKMAGINIVHVPYKGAAAALADVMSGHMESSVGNLAGGPLAAIKARRVRALGVTSGKRNAQVPDVPTFAEQGVKDYDVTGWYGLCTQSKVPQAIISRINTDLNKLLAGATLRKRLEDQGITLTPGTPEAFAAHVKAEQEKWTKVVRDAKLPGE